MDTKDFILPTLDNKQSGVRQKKYYNGYYYNVKKIISKNKDVSNMGNVVTIDKDNLIVKWNRLKKHKKDMLQEVRYQNAMGLLGYGPMLRYKYQTKNNVFIIMDNLIESGYSSLSNVLKDSYITGRANDITGRANDIKKNVAKSINNMHKNNIIHGDLHESNIFYNIKTNSVKFIDFSKTVFTSSYKNAIDNETYLFYKSGLRNEMINLLIEIDQMYENTYKKEDDEYSSDYTTEYYTEYYTDDDDE